MGFTNFSFFKRVTFFAFAFLTVSSLFTNKFNFFKASSTDLLPTHKEVPVPPDLISGNEILLVSLADYLGKGLNESNSVPALRLISAGKSLILTDANGVQHKESEITIAWRKKTLKSPLKVSRQIIGPFASFESAQKVSKFLKHRGIESLIAHPSAWEVWVQKEIQIPENLNSRFFDKEYLFEITPVLIGNVGEISLASPISIKAEDGLLWNGGVYLGPFSIRPDSYGSWTFLEHVPIERYLSGVVPYEIGASSPFEALSAQAVLARTWALANSHRFEVDGYHLCSDTQCQVYRDPSAADLTVIKAIKKTAGKILSWKNKPIHAVYHATNGGVMASMDEAWSIDPLPYSKVVIDGPQDWARGVKSPLNKHSYLRAFLTTKSHAYGTNHHLFRWRRTYTEKEIKKSLAKWFSIDNFDSSPTIRVLSRGLSGRVLSLEIIGRKDVEPIVLKLDNIRRVLTKLPSTLFIVQEIDKGVWEFNGGGFGHGAGMSQAGAIDLARRGWSAEKILMHYYPGAIFESFLP